MHGLGTIVRLNSQPLPDHRTAEEKLIVKQAGELSALAYKQTQEREELAEQTRLENARANNRTVWILVGSYDYEGDSFLAVWDHKPTSEEEALKSTGGFDNYIVAEYELEG